jgi:spore coat polysaccharide biosynthesis predicted glycosyltransferase SpsG
VALPDIAILRADVSERIGHGHISRATAMGRVLARFGVPVEIYCRNFAVNAQAYSSHLARMPGDIQVISSEEEYCRAITGGSRKCIFIDLLSDRVYEPLIPCLKRAGQAGNMLVCFDEFFPGRVTFDLIVRPFHEVIVESENILTGLQYYVYPDILSSVATLKKPFAGARNVLISMGGSDPHGVSLPLAKMLAAKYPGLNFMVVIGPGFSAGAQCALEALSANHTNLQCTVRPETLNQLYLATDVAITSAGLTKFETALFGIPSIILANNDQEAQLIGAFCKFGTGIYAGKSEAIELESFAAGFDDFITDHTSLVQMSSRGRETMDVLGGERVIEYIRQNTS